MTQKWTDFAQYILDEMSIGYSYKNDIMELTFQAEDPVVLTRVFLDSDMQDNYMLIMEMLSEGNIDIELSDWADMQINRWYREDGDKIEDLFSYLLRNSMEVKSQAALALKNIQDELRLGWEKIWIKYCLPEDDFDW